MVLCVWTAVHLNLPEHNRAHTHKWRKLEWLLIGLIAPEMVGYSPIEIPNSLICRIQVAWTVFEQRRDARALCRLMRQAFSQPKLSSFLDSVIKFTRRVDRFNNSSPGSDELRDQIYNVVGTTRKHSWTMIHSHFAIMGGFAFDTGTGVESFLPGQRTRVILSNRGVYALAQNSPEFLPNFSEQQIQDKSKANNLA